MLHLTARDVPANEADVIGDCFAELVANFFSPIDALIIAVFSLTPDKGDDIVEVFQLVEWVRGRAGVLDAEGNYTVMTEKGFAIGSVGLASQNHWRGLPPQVGVFTGLLFGGTLPYELVVLSNESVENAADVLMKECVQRFPRGIPSSAVVDWTTEEPGTVCLVLGSLRPRVTPNVIGSSPPASCGL